MSSNKSVRPEESGVVQALEERDLSLVEGLGKYRLVGGLGHGGMADVYLAVADGPEGFRKLCVLKLLKDSMMEDEEYRAMFLDEARLAARLNHPNIVQTFEVGETHGRLMIAMEYVEGQAATRVRRRLEPAQFPLAAQIGVLCEVLEALEYAHGLSDFDGSSLGIVHRDVSPHNVIIGYDARVKLVDFGIAKSSAAMQETQAGVLKGKVGYMAPEQASMRHVDGRADVFSVGVMLWEAIAGRRLAEGMSGNDVLLRRVEGKDPKIIELAPDVDPALAAICDRAMALSPDDRYMSAAELQGQLEQWLRQHGEPNRKELSKSVREAFAKEREQLRALVEQRMADSAMSGVRHALTERGELPSIGRLHAGGGGGGGGGTESMSLTPGRGGPASLRATEPDFGRSGPHSTLPMTDLAQNNSTLVTPPPALSADDELGPRRAGPPAAVLAAIAAFVVVIGILAAVLALKTPTPPERVAGDVPSADVSAAPGMLDSASVPLVATPPLAVTAAAAASSASAGDGNTRPVVVAPAVPMARATPPARAAASTTVATAIPSAAPAPVVTTPRGTGLTSPVHNKQPARPLDEKDPYAQ